MSLTGGAKTSKGQDMRHLKLTTCASVLALCLAAGSARADSLLGSYEARISQRDKQASDGYALDTAAQMVRQDRANWHKFGSGDDEDQGDDFFATTQSRVKLENMLNKKDAMNPATRKAIVRGEPVIQVDVYRYSVRVGILAN